MNSEEKNKEASFEEAPVSSDEIQAEAQRRLDSGGCGVCGRAVFIDTCSDCGVGVAFSRTVLTHVLAGEPTSSFILSEKPTVRKSLRASVDAELLIASHKSRLGIRKIDDVLPSVAAEYVKQMLPYIQKSLKRAGLVRAGLPSFTVGKFNACVRTKADILTTISIEKYLQKHRRELGTQFFTHVDLFTRTLTYYGATPAREAIAVKILRGKGASEPELTEALSDSALRREIRSKGKLERKQLVPPDDESFIEQTDDTIVIQISLKETPEGKRAEEDNFFACDLDRFSVINDQPSLILSHRSITAHKLALFSSHQNRRDFIFELMKLSPPERLRCIKSVESNALAGRIISAFTTSA